MQVKHYFCPKAGGNLRPCYQLGSSKKKKKPPCRTRMCICTQFSADQWGVGSSPKPFLGHSCFFCHCLLACALLRRCATSPTVLVNCYTPGGPRDASWLVSAEATTFMPLSLCLFTASLNECSTGWMSVQRLHAVLNWEAYATIDLV